MSPNILPLLWMQTWQIAMLAIGIFATSRFIAKNRPHLAHAMWILVLIKCITPPVWASSFGVFSQLQTLVDDNIETAAPELAAAQFLPEVSIRETESEPLIIESYGGIEPAIDPLPEVDASSSPRAEIMLPEEPTEDAAIELAAALPIIKPAVTTVDEIEIDPSLWPQRLLAIVAVGAMLTLLIIVVRCVRCLRLIQSHRTTEFDDALNERLRQLAKQLNIRRVPHIVVSDVLFGPAVLGLLRHTIVLPKCLLSRSFLPEMTSQPAATCDQPMFRSKIGQTEITASSVVVPSCNQNSQQNEHVIHVAALHSFDHDRSLVAASCEVLLGKQDLQFLDPILAHELLHIRRGDLRFGMLQVIAQSLWWFHPAVWFANRWLSREAERCCDEQVIAELGCTPSQYARSLLAVIESKHTLQPIPVFPGMKPVEITTQRMERIMSLKNGLNKRTPLWCWLAVAALAIVVLPGAVAKSLPEEAAAEPTVQTPTVEETSANAKGDEIATHTFEGNGFWTKTHLEEVVAAASDAATSREATSENIKDAEIFAVKLKYCSVGFFDVEVNAVAKTPSDSTLTVRHFKIVEGVRYKIREIRFEGNKRIATADLKAELSLKRGDLYDATDVARDLKKFQTLIGPEARLNPVPHFIETPGIVDLVFEIDESPQVSESTSDPLKASSTSAVPPREAIREESYDVKDLLERLSKDQNVPADLARQLLVGYIKSATRAVLETPTALPVVLNATPLEPVPLPQPESTERKPLEPPKLKELSSIALDGSQLFVLHTTEGQQQVQNSINQFRQFGFQQFLVSVQFITGSTEDLKKLIAELPDPQHIDINPNADLKVLTAAESVKILERIKESDSAQLESAPSVVAFNGQMAEVFSGVERPFVVGFDNGQPQLKMVKNGITLSIKPTLLDTGLLGLSCIAQTDDITSLDAINSHRPAASATRTQYQMPRVTSKRIQTNVELKDDQNLLISGLSTYVAKDKETKSLVVLLRASIYIDAVSTNNIRLHPTSDLKQLQIASESSVALAEEPLPWSRPDHVQTIWDASNLINRMAKERSVARKLAGEMVRAEVERLLNSVVDATTKTASSFKVTLDQERLVNVSPRKQSRHFAAIVSHFEKHGFESYLLEVHAFELPKETAESILDATTVVSPIEATPAPPSGTEPTTPPAAKKPSNNVRNKIETDRRVRAMLMSDDQLQALRAKAADGSGDHALQLPMVVVQDGRIAEYPYLGSRDIFANVGLNVTVEQLEQSLLSMKCVIGSRVDEKFNGEKTTIQSSVALADKQWLVFQGLTKTNPDGTIHAGLIAVRAQGVADVAIPQQGETISRLPIEDDPAKFIVNVSGAVREPGTYLFDADRDNKLLDAIAKVGGLSDDAGKTIIVKRKDDDGNVTLIQINRVEVAQNNNNSNIILAPRDVVVVHRVEDDEAVAKSNAAVAARLCLATYSVADLIVPTARTIETAVTRSVTSSAAAIRAIADVPETFPVPQPALSATKQETIPVYTKEDFASLIELIKASVDPDSWENKGTIAVEIENISLVIRQTDKAHGEIATLLSSLRKAHANVKIESLLLKLTTDEQFKVIEEHNSLHSLADGMKWALLTPKRSETFTKTLLDQKPDVISSPRMMTISGQAATVMVGSMDKSVFSGFKMTVTPQVVPDSSIIRLQHQISIGTDRQQDTATDTEISVGSFELVAQGPGNSEPVMHESLVGSGQTLLLLIERPRPDDATKSVDRYVLLLTPEHLKEEEAKVGQGSASK